MEARKRNVFSREPVVEVEVLGSLIKDVDFVLFADIELFFIVDSVYISLNQRFEFLCFKIESGYAIGAKQVDFAFFITGDAQHRIAEQTVRIVLVEFETQYVVSVVAV